MVRDPDGAALSRFEFCCSVEDLIDLLEGATPAFAVVIFRNRQLPLRGRVDDELISRAVEVIPDGEPWTIAAGYPRLGRIAKAIGSSHKTLRESLTDELVGEEVALGLEPKWWESECDQIIWGIVPGPDGAFDAAIARREEVAHRLNAAVRSHGPVSAMRTVAAALKTDGGSQRDIYDALCTLRDSFHNEVEVQATVNAVLHSVVGWEPDPVFDGPLRESYWDLVFRLVPKSGSAETVQGELVRAALRLGAELSREGCGNWDDYYERLCDFAVARLSDGTLENDTASAAERTVERLRAYGRSQRDEDADEDEDEYDELCDELDNRLQDAAVKWCYANPYRIPYRESHSAEDNS